MVDSTFIQSPICDSKLDYICYNCDCVKEYEADDFMIGYQLSGSCRIISKDCCMEVGEHKLFLVERGSYKIESMTGKSGSFEQMLFRLDAEAIFGSQSRDCSRREERFERAVLHGIITSLTIEDLAQSCCTSLSTFKRRFSERFAHSPHRWFLSCRLDIAERIVGHSGVAVADLAEMCGFSNTSHFICAFRNRFGATPLRHARCRYSATHHAL